MWKWLQGFWKSSRPSEQAQSAAPPLSPTRRQPASTPAIARRPVAKATVQVGIDFGTAVTKVLYRVLPHEAVLRPNLSAESSDYPGFLVPSVIALSEDSRLLVGAQAYEYLKDKPWGTGLSRLKMLVAGRVDASYLDLSVWARYQQEVKAALGDSDALSPEVASGIFLADVMRRVRAQLKSEVTAQELDIRFNVGVPIDQAENAVVLAAFGRVAAIAQALYEQLPEASSPEREWISLANRLAVSCVYDEKAPATRVFLIPEAVASFASYQASQKKREGIHALVDIGGGTTDISIAYLAVPKHTTAGSQWWAARSLPDGMGRIEDEVAKVIGANGSSREKLRAEVRAALKGKGPHAHIAQQVVTQKLRDIWTQSCYTWGQAYEHNPAQGKWTQEKVTVYLAGGGAALPAAHKVFSESWMPSWGPYQVAMLPAPDSDPEIKGVPFTRLSVAYGLCRDKPDLDDTTLPGRAPFYRRPPPTGPQPDDFDGPT